ncbi:uncharacterized protein SPAPADRAFT_49794 [Spathaspora passalidarum NRRL Y-27907]|uniref:PPIase cyclophilin-type domain-containing protein n=1 Tax=Spathaspora passalidarum (strain NRRL Y-27907 / 11-Y1) TaxID=619300 RepID=G3AK47_SPAPN|nr:uncharacterized protein SPAPADRAFT_49794 [Spathaspora passalidarum NRRL Y-27907]EGW32858.1 hypothetical protein SPAPADRAFT_49794 [Spathaspora passalidarum NRRL Y-27907]
MSDLNPTAKARIQTTKGPLEIDLYARETPQTARQFLTHILNQKYTSLQFTPSSTSITVSPTSVNYDIADEFHSRIKFKRGTLAALRDSKNHNSVDGFFIVLNDSPELTGQYVPLGIVVGTESLYTIKTIADGELDNEGVPVFPVSIVSSEVITSYFDDLKKEEKEVMEVERPVKKSKVVVRYDESDDDDDDDEFTIRSAHDVLKDKSLSTEVASKEVEDIPIQKEAVEQEDGQESDHSVDEEGGGEEEEEDSSSDESDNSQKHIHIQVVRDPTIDSDYDTNLDLSESENPITLHMLKQHTFTT